jgi:hypothetical protein
MPEKDKGILRGHEGISRRTMLKRIGAGAAVAWSAPVLTSLGTPAFAQTPICRQPCDYVCGGEITYCGSSSCEFPECACEQDTENNCMCAQNAGCDDLRPCTSSDDCINGGRCVFDTCCGGGVCIRDCGDCDPTAPNRRSRRGTKTALG